MKSIFILVFLSGSILCHGQEGKITVVKDTSIQRVLNLYQTFATQKRTVNGYRIQLASDNSRQELLNIKAKFIQQFPDYSAYIEYSAPQFKLRVGDFESRTAADNFLNEVRNYFSVAFIVPDKVMVEGVKW